MNSQDMQVIGLCRFSYPAQGGFQVEHDSDTARMAYLWSEHRMQERFRTFECFTLPALKAQSDQNFTFLVVIGDQMPAQYRDRLMDLVSDMPQAIVQGHTPGPHRQVMKDAINSVREDRPAPSLQFRMDDDDAVSVRYVEELRAAAEDLRPLIRKNRHVGIDFNQGWIARPGKDGLMVKRIIEPLWTAALAISVKPAAQNTIMNFGHSKLARHMPVVSYTGEDMYLRGHNDHNDSRQKKRGVRQFDLTPITPDEAEFFRLNYNVDVERVRSFYA